MIESISVIIPTLDEVAQLPMAIASAAAGKSVEIIVADGGSRDGTLEVARLAGVRVAHSNAGKAAQMNAGAKLATGEILVFLHADTILPKGFDKQIREILAMDGIVAGAFRLAIDNHAAALRIIERIANWRSIFLQMPYGDQAIFMRAEIFQSIGNFPDLPLMEDFEMVRRLKKAGTIAIAADSILTSARRWQRLGVLRTTVINQSLIASYLAGINPDTLAKWYGIMNRNFYSRLE